VAEAKYLEIKSAVFREQAIQKLRKTQDWPFRRQVAMRAWLPDDELGFDKPEDGFPIVNQALVVDASGIHEPSEIAIVGHANDRIDEQLIGDGEGQEQQDRDFQPIGPEPSQALLEILIPCA
jgi:hypothetical protein